MKFLLLVIGCITGLQALATPYSLEGYKVDAYMERTRDSGYGLGRIDGYGLDAPFEVQTGTADEKQYSSAFKLNVDKDKFVIDFISYAGWQDGTVFNLVQPDWATTTLENFWYGLGSDTNIDGLGIDIGYGWVKLDFSNTHFTEDSYFIGYFNYQEVDVPEPASYILLIIGLLCIYIRIIHRRNT